MLAFEPQAENTSIIPRNKRTWPTSSTLYKKSPHHISAVWLGPELRGLLATEDASVALGPWLK